MDSFDRMRLPGYVPSTPARGRELTDAVAARVDTALAPYRHLAAEAHMMVRHDERLNAELEDVTGSSMADAWSDMDMNRAVEAQALAWVLCDLMHASDATGASWAVASRLAGEWYHYQRQGILRQIVWRGEPEPENDGRPHVRLGG